MFKKNKSKNMKILLSEQQLILLTQQYAAGVLPICRNTGRICLQYRGAKITEPHTWATWGGGMSIGESPKETATREFFEESGVFAPITLIDSWVDIKQSGFKYFNFIGLVNDEFKPLVGKYTVDGDVEIEDYKWVTFDEFKNMVGKKDTHFGINSLYKNAGEQIKEIIGKHCNK